ncbi:MAG: MFS transporter [Chloroflexi bacterium]|nr:MFS transporter [Chloroflexota bacterium]
MVDSAPRYSGADAVAPAEVIVDAALGVVLEAGAGRRVDARRGGLLAALCRTYPALGARTFCILWLGTIPSTLAWQMSVVATGYAALTISGSAIEMGLVTMLGGLPMLVLSPLGGVAADRFPRRNVLVCTQVTLGSGALALAILGLLDVLETWHLGALAFVQGIAFSFNMPARQAFAAELAGPRLVRSAVALNTASQNFCRVAGPSLAGALLSVPWLGVGGVFAAMTLLYGTVLLTLFHLPLQPITRAPGSRTGLPSVGAELAEGLRYIAASPTHVALLGMALVTLVFGSPILQIMPLFSERVFHIGAAGLGGLMAANGVGALAGALVAAALTGVRRLALLQTGLGIGFGLALAGFAAAPTVPVAVLMLALFGACSAAYLSLNGTLLLGNTEPHLYGRVTSIYLMTFAITPIAALPLAWAADQVGPRVAAAGAGLVVAGAVAVVAARSPSFHRIR